MAAGEKADDPASISGLLRSYDRARARAAVLRPVVLTRSRPCVWWSLPLPRPTLLTRFYLSRHIDRSLGALERNYNAREALGTIDDAMQRDRDLCSVYRRSLRTPRQIVAVFVYVVLALMCAQILVVKSEIFEGLIAKIIWLPNYDAVTADEESPVREALRLIAKTLTGSPATSVDVLDRTLDMEVPTVLVLLSAVIFVAYLVTRMLVPAFRLKRQLLCLADQTEWGVHDAATGWFVNKSVGAYAREHAVFRRVQAQPPAEWPIDLIILTGPPLLLLAISIGYLRFAEGDAYLLALSVWFLAAFVLRTWWLCSCNRQRHAQPDPAGSEQEFFGRIAPFVARGPSDRPVEGRIVAGVAALPLLAELVVPFLDNVVPNRWLPKVEESLFEVALIVVPAVMPWLVSGSWFRLSKITRRIEDLRRKGPRPRGRGWVSTLFFVSIVLSPLVVTRDLWRLDKLIDDRSRQARLHRIAALGLVVSVLHLAFWLMLVVLLTDPGVVDSLYTLFAVAATLVVFGYGVLLGAVQWAHNILIPDCFEVTDFGRCADS